MVLSVGDTPEECLNIFSCGPGLAMCVRKSEKKEGVSVCCVASRKWVIERSSGYQIVCVWKYVNLIMFISLGNMCSLSHIFNGPH